MSNRFISKTQYYSREEMNLYQIKNLKNIFINAYRNIPYYNRLFWLYDFNPSQFKFLDELERLPILLKSQVIAAPKDFISRIGINNAIELHTSGTTGSPLTTFTSTNQWIVEQAAIWRQWSWAGYRLLDRMAIFRSYAPKINEPIYHLDKKKIGYMCLHIT